MIDLEALIDKLVLEEIGEHENNESFRIGARKMAEHLLKENVKITELSSPVIDKL